MVVGELPKELVVLRSQQGRLVVQGRVPKELSVQPYWDRRWLRVTVGADKLYVSRRNFGTVVERFVTAAEA
jgi:hypothetical protein